MTPFTRYRLPALAWALVVAMALLTPHRRITGIDRPVPAWIEEGTHVAVFLILFVLVHRLLAAAGAMRRPALGALVLTVAYGLLLELGQHWIPGRGFEWLDLLMNLVGGLLGMLLVRFRGRRSL